MFKNIQFIVQTYNILFYVTKTDNIYTLLVNVILF